MEENARARGEGWCGKHYTFLPQGGVRRSILHPVLVSRDVFATKHSLCLFLHVCIFSRLCHFIMWDQLWLRGRLRDISNAARLFEGAFGAGEWRGLSAICPRDRCFISSFGSENIAPLSPRDKPVSIVVGWRAGRPPPSINPLLPPSLLARLLKAWPLWWTPTIGLESV